MFNRSTLRLFKGVLAFHMIAAVLLLGIAGTAFAQESGARKETLEEVTVTARRIEESLQEAPVAVTAMTADFLDAQRIQSVAQVLEATPGATFVTLNKAQFNFGIRGISSQGEGASADSAVMTVVDNVVIGKDFMKSFKFYDIEQVEVMRGPQGTVFGRNAAAGAIHIISARPSREFEGFVEATAGNQGLFELNGAINGAIGDTTAGRLSVHVDDFDGFTLDEGTGTEVDGASNFSIRGQLLFDPSESVDILLRAEYSEDDDGNRIRKGPDCTVPYLEDPFGDFTDSCDPWTTTTSEAVDGPFFFKRDISSLAATIDWDISDSLSLTSITAFIDASATSNQDNFGTPVNVVYSIGDDDASQFTQEFRIDNASSGANTTWMLGAFYLTDEHDRSDGRQLVNHLGDPFETNDVNVTTNETTSLGLFGQVDFSLSDRVNLTIGGRYTSDDKDFDILHTASGALADIFLDPAEDPIVASVSQDWSNFSGSVSLRYAASESSTLYLLASQGYKSGGFNGEPYTYEAAITPYDEETSLNVEAGAKMDLADDRLRLNIAIFNLDYDNLQVEGQLPSGTPFIDNASGADVAGVEVEFTWLASENLTFLGSYAYIDAEMRGTISGFPVDGYRPPESPDWTASFAVDLAFPLNNGSILGFRGDYRSRGTAYVGYLETGPRPGVDMFGAKAYLSSPDGRWQFSLWGRNLTEEAEIVSIGPDALVSQNPTGYGAPMTYGATARFSF